MTDSPSIFRKFGFPIKTSLPSTRPLAMMDNLARSPMAGPDANPVLKPGLDYKPRPTFSQYWNTPMEGSGLTRADHLHRIGSALRDPDHGSSPTDTFTSFQSPPSVAPARGGAAGGTRSAVGRRWQDRW